MKKHIFNLKALALAASTLFLATGCKDGSLTEEDILPPETLSYTVRIVVSDVMATQASVRTTSPSNAVETYRVGTMLRSEFDAFATPGDVIEADRNDLLAKAEAAGAPLDEYLSSELTSGYRTTLLEGLSAETDYVVYAYGLSVAGAVTTDLSTASFRTMDAVRGMALRIEVSEITGTSAVMTVTPGNANLDYYYDILPAGEVDKYSDEELVALLDADGKLSDYCDRGPQTYAATDLDPGTAYYALAFVHTKAGVTGPVRKVAFSTLDTSTAPEIEATLFAGTFDGNAFNDPETTMTVLVELTGGVVASGRMVLLSTSEVEQVLAMGATYEDIIGLDELFADDDLSEQMIASMNEAGGLVTFYDGLEPGESYTLIVRVADAAGNTAVAHAEEATENNQPPTDAYKAWLGTWTVTSASSEGAGTPKTFDIVLSQRSANRTYTVTGLSTSIMRTGEGENAALQPQANFDAETGGFTIPDQQIGSFTDEELGPCMFLYTSRFRDPEDDRIYVTFAADALAASLGEDGTTATLTGMPVSDQTGKEIGVVTWMDFFYWFTQASAQGPVVMGATPVDMFRYQPEGADKAMIDYPIGPFTLVKKSAAEPSTLGRTSAAGTRRAAALGAARPQGFAAAAARPGVGWLDCRPAAVGLRSQSRGAAAAPETLHALRGQRTDASEILLRSRRK